VNLASRVSGVAEPGTVLATRSLRDAAPNGYAWRSEGRRRLRGVTEDVELFTLVGGSSSSR